MYIKLYLIIKYKNDFITAHNRIFITIKNRLISIYRFEENILIDSIQNNICIFINITKHEISDNYVNFFYIYKNSSLKIFKNFQKLRICICIIQCRHRS